MIVVPLRTARPRSIPKDEPRFHLPLGGSLPGTPGHTGDVHDCAICTAYRRKHPSTPLPSAGPPAKFRTVRGHLRQVYP